jgi:hypothetical protein
MMTEAIAAMRDQGRAMAEAAVAGVADEQTLTALARLAGALRAGEPLGRVATAAGLKFWVAVGVVAVVERQRRGGRG